MNTEWLYLFTLLVKSQNASDGIYEHVALWILNHQYSSKM